MASKKKKPKSPLVTFPVHKNYKCESMMASFTPPPSSPTPLSNTLYVENKINFFNQSTSKFTGFAHWTARSGFEFDFNFPRFYHIPFSKLTHPHPPPEKSTTYLLRPLNLDKCEYDFTFHSVLIPRIPIFIFEPKCRYLFLFWIIIFRNAWH